MRVGSEGTDLGERRTGQMGESEDEAGSERSDGP